MNSWLSKLKIPNQRTNEVSDEPMKENHQEESTHGTPADKPVEVKQTRLAAVNNKTRVQPELKSEIETRAQKRQKQLEQTLQRNNELIE
jgi:hypothetical protein